MRPKKEERVLRFGAGMFALILLSATPAIPRSAEAQSCEHPAVLLVVDRSSSMNGTIDGERKWDIAREAILGMVDGFQDGIHFGLMIYPGPSGTGANGIEGDVPACAIEPPTCSPERPKCTTGEVVVDIGPDAPGLIHDWLLTPPPAGGAYTPTWQSLEAADRYQLLHNPNRRNFVVLITDGWQCCGINNNNECMSNATERFIMVDKVAQLFEHEITTYVIGFGDTNGAVDVLALNRAADVGGTGVPGCNPNSAEPSCYSMASNHEQLAGFLEGIARQISEEICDGKDNDCDGQIDGIRRGCQSLCGPGEETCVNGVWQGCNAPNPVAEICDGQDNNCNGVVDEGLMRACNTACGPGTETCSGGQWVNCSAREPRPEICDGVDNDCNGEVDEGCGCEEGARERCGIQVGVCQQGWRTCTNGAWGACEGGRGPEAEVCDGLDNDCDGTVDSIHRDCSSACGAGSEVCLNGNWVGCDAPLPAAERCNGLDDDCDGQTDEEVTRSCDNGCPGQEGIQTCTGPDEWSACNAPRPMEDEICGDGKDNDCNGLIDDGCTCDDGDTQPCGSAQGECQQGVQTCAHGQWGACLGGNQPQEESCDSKDNDCDGQTDELTEEPCSNDCGEGVRHCIDGQLGPCSVPDPPAEVCDGLDNDCDNLQDEGDLCDQGLRCFCGACAGQCTHGECEGDADCIDGYCIVDRCPAGFHCEGTACVPGDEGGGEGEGHGGEGEGSGRPGKGGSAGAVEDGCGCRTAASLDGAAKGLPLLLLLSSLLLGLRRRG